MSDLFAGLESIGFGNLSEMKLFEKKEKSEEKKDPALDAYYRKTSILGGLGHTKEHKPQHTLQCGRDRECHLCKREYIEDHARSQDDDTGAE